VPDLRNVIVFALAGSRYAAELRWVREVITLGFVTEVPTAPPGLAGIFNLRGTIVPVLDLPALLGTNPPATPRQGDGALLLEADHALAALRVDTIDEVGTLPSGPGPATVIDARGRMVAVVDPPGLLRRAAAAAWAVRGIPPPSDDENDTWPGGFGIAPGEPV
jgi:chemotaxis signal transduction protein